MRAWAGRCERPGRLPGGPGFRAVGACALLAAALGLSGWPLRAADAAAALRDGQVLAAELRAQHPAEALATAGMVRVRNAQGKWRPGVPVHLEVRLAQSEWTSTYRTVPTNGSPVEVLQVVHREAAPNAYLYLGPAASAGPDAQPSLLEPRQLTNRFAASDFWLCDLGLEFFHWPDQRLLKPQMRKGRACRVLESRNPDPAPGGYARVLSWIDTETSGLLRAEAYGTDGALLKEFSVGSFKKVNGRWQLKSMEIRNEQDDARTRLEFDLEVE